jgi:glycosyltransferase involved in cell wall biosynthesis
MTGPIDEVRNLAISKATSDLVICLDADDELEPGYVEAMLVGTGDLRYPMMRYVQDGDCVIPAPIELPKRPLAQGNYMCIGTLFPRDLFIKVGGYSSWESWEDYHLFCKLVLYGARTNLCRNAIYRAHSTKQGRCNAVKNPQALMKSILDSLKPLELSSGISLSEVH